MEGFNMASQQGSPPPMVCSITSSASTAASLTAVASAPTLHHTDHGNKNQMPGESVEAPPGSSVEATPGPSFRDGEPRFPGSSPNARRSASAKSISGRAMSSESARDRKASDQALDSRRNSNKDAVLSAKAESWNDGRKERSLSPPAVGQKSGMQVSGLARSLRDRDDEIARLKEQVRNATRAAKCSPTQGDGEAGKNRLFEENAKLRRDVAQLHDALKTRCEGGKSEEPTWRAGAFAAKQSLPNSSVSVAAAAAAAAVATSASPSGAEEAPAPLPSAKARGEEMHSRKESIRSRESQSVYRQASVSGADRQREMQAMATNSGKGRDGRPSNGRTSPPARTSSPRSLLANQVGELQRQLKEKDDDIRIIEERWCSKLALLEARYEELKTTQQLKDQRASASNLTEQLAEERRARQRAEEESRRADSEGSQCREQLRFEREQWRQEREVMHNDLRRLEKAEDNLRRQLSGVQERLDSTQLSHSEREQERRHLKTQVLELTEKAKEEGNAKEDELALKNAALESQVHSQHLELTRLRQQMHRLEGERSEAYARLATLPPREAVAVADNRAGGRGRGRLIPPGGRGSGVGPARRGGSPTPAGRGLGSNSGQPIVPGLGLHSRVPAGSLPLQRLQPAEPNAAVRSPSCSSYSSSGSESSMGPSSVDTATGKRSYPQLCAVFGDAPLQKFPDMGWYFRLKIISVNPGFVGGFGVGITLSTPAALATLPDRASRVQRSWLAGYWGRTFSNGSERLSEWKPQDLQTNDEVGFLVTLEGICVVYINDAEQCRFGHHQPVPVKSGMCTDGEPQLTALIDVARTCLDFSMMSGALPPRPGANGAQRAAIGSKGGADAGYRAPSPDRSPVPSTNTSATPSVSAVGTAAGPEATPPPPPPSPSRTSSPQPRFGPPLKFHPVRTGGTSPPPVPPLLPLRQGLSANQRSTSGSPGPVKAHSNAPGAVAARKVPQLPLHSLNVEHA